MTDTTRSPSGAKNVLQDLLREEHAAATMCDRALDKVGGAAQQGVVLGRAFAAHRQAADLLRAHLCHHGIPLPEDSGQPAEREARAIEQAQSPDDALEVVRRVERSAIARYEQALVAPSLAPDCRTVIQQSLLPDRERDASALSRETGRR